LFGATGNMLQNFSNEINTLKTNTKNALNEIKQPMAQAQQPLIQQEINKIPPQNIIPPVNPVIVPVVKKQTNPMVKNMPLVSDISKKKQDIKPTQTKSSIDTDADLYENFRNDQAPKQTSKPQKTIANPMFNNPNIISTPQKKPIEKELSQNMNLAKQSIQQSQPVAQTKSASSANNQPAKYRLFIALFDYDPYQMSPNQDSCSEELPFKEGQLIKVFGEQDDDGFYYGESNGRSGYIPCNMIQEVQDQNMISQLKNEQTNPNTSQQGAMESDPRKNNSKRSNSPNSKTKTTKQQSTTKVQAKEQSFQPVNNQNQYKTPAKNVCTMIAMYDYDPQSLSPNVDVDIELPFKTGEIITVIGEMDEDGFFMAELKGKRGLVPSNFLQPIQQQPVNDQYYNQRK